MTQKSLLEIQKQVQHVIQSGEISTDVLAGITEKPPMSASARIGIYQDAYIIRKANSIREDFESLSEFIGEETFEKLIVDFIRKTPSTTRNLAEYSFEFPEFIRHVLPDYYEKALTLWLRIVASHLPESPVSLSQDQILAGQPFTVSRVPSVVVQPLSESILLAYRKGPEAEILKLSKSQARLIEFLSEGRSLEDLEKEALRADLDSDYLIQTIFTWVRDGLVVCQPTSIEKAREE